MSTIFAPTKVELTSLLIGASLKMYFSHSRQVQWTRDVAAICVSHPAVEGGFVTPFVIPTFPSIPEAVQVARAGRMLVGAQDVHWEDSGAFTGEVSPAELSEHGVTLVEIGHAERRAMFGETDATIALKMAAAFRNRITPILCVGEEQRRSPEAAVAACTAQIEVALSKARETSVTAPFVVAYEPIWAIGAATPASDDHIREVCGALRDHLRDEPASPAKVIYGGSAGEGLLPRIGDGVDGMFLGRFAHDPAAFGRILDEAMDFAGAAQ